MQQQQQIETQVIHTDYLRNKDNVRALSEAGWVYGDRGAANPDLQIWLRPVPIPQSTTANGHEADGADGARTEVLSRE